LEEVRAWVREEHRRATGPYPALAANAALSLLNICCYLLDRQLAAQAQAFEKEGGFTERMYRTRNRKRRNERHTD
jgi:four helix bundle suffix protein